MDSSYSSHMLAEAALPPRPWLRAMGRGLRKRCPQCGAPGVFDGYIRTRSTCGGCGLNLDGHQADDAPPYLTVMIVGHLVIPLALAAKQVFDPPLGLQFAIWTPILILFSAWLLPVMKGGMIGVQWANRMHGFAAAPADEAPLPH